MNLVQRLTTSAHIAAQTPLECRKSEALQQFQRSLYATLGNYEAHLAQALAKWFSLRIQNESRALHIPNTPTTLCSPRGGIESPVRHTDMSQRWRRWSVPSVLAMRGPTRRPLVNASRDNICGHSEPNRPRQLTQRGTAVVAASMHCETKFPERGKRPGSEQHLKLHIHSRYPIHSQRGH